MRITDESARCMCGATIWDWVSSDRGRKQMLLIRAQQWWYDNYREDDFDEILDTIGKRYQPDEQQLIWAYGPEHHWIRNSDFREIRSRVSRVCGALQMQVMEYIMIRTRPDFELTVTNQVGRRTSLLKPRELQSGCESSNSSEKWYGGEYWYVRMLPIYGVWYDSGSNMTEY